LCKTTKEFFPSHSKGFWKCFVFLRQMFCVFPKMFCVFAEFLPIFRPMFCTKQQQNIFPPEVVFTPFKAWFSRVLR
jgi:hypothetical protein